MFDCPATTPLRSLAPSVDNLLVDAEGSRLQAVQAPFPQAVSASQVIQTQSFWEPFTESSLIYPHPSPIGAPKLVKVKQLCSNECCDHLPAQSACIAFHTVIRSLGFQKNLRLEI